MLLQIKIWFQNRRARERREKSGNVVPPTEITLPSTVQQSLSPTTVQQSWLGIYFQNAVKLESPVEAERSDTIKNKQMCSLNLSCNDQERSETPLDVETLDN